MKIGRISVFICLLSAGTAFSARAQVAAPAATSPAPVAAAPVPAVVATNPPAVVIPANATRVMIIGTLSGNPEGAYARNMRDWMERFAALLTRQYGVPEKNIMVFAEAAPAPKIPGVKESTFANLRAAFETLQAQVPPDGQFILFIVGHGTVTEPVGKLCLPGPDINALDLGAYLNNIQANNMVIINCASGGWEVASKICKRGRVIISACGIKGEGVQPYYAEFILRGYETGKADANNDGVITVLEAFNWSAAECVNWYHRQYRGAGLGAISISVRGRESNKIFDKLYAGSKIVKSGGDATGADFEPSLMGTEGGDTGWATRRETSELAAYDDQGAKMGFVHWLANSHIYLEGKPGAEGEYGACMVIGKPELLPAK